MDAESATVVSSNGIRTAVCTKCLVPLQIRRTLNQYSLPYIAQLYGNNGYKNSSLSGRKFISPYSSYAEQQFSPQYSPFSRHLLKNRYKPGSYPQLLVQGRSKERTIASPAKFTKSPRPRSTTERPFKITNKKLRSKSATVFGINYNRRPLTGVQSSLTISSCRNKEAKRPASVSSPYLSGKSMLENRNKSSKFHSGCHAPVHALVPVLASDELVSQVSCLDLSDNGNEGSCDEDLQATAEHSDGYSKRDLSLKEDGIINYWQPYNIQKGSAYDDPAVKGSSQYHRHCCHIHRPDLTMRDGSIKWQNRANSIRDSFHRYKFTRDEAGFLMDCETKLSQLQEKFSDTGNSEPNNGLTGRSKKKMVAEDKPNRRKLEFFVH